MNSRKKRIEKKTNTHPALKSLSFTDRISALKNIPRFFRLVWQTNPKLAIINALLRVARSTLPLGILYVGKLVIDEVILLAGAPGKLPADYLWQLVAIEFGLVIVSEVLTRAINLADSLLGDLFSNHTSIKIMDHAAKLDLDQFEDSHFYDKLERARQQTVGRTILMSQVLGQVQDLTTVIFLSIGLIAFNPWLILLLLLAVIPSFLGESHFNVRSYALSRGQTPERRELDYLRYIGASDETAKEVKIFNLSGFIIERFRHLSGKFYVDNRLLAVKRSAWGSIFSMISSIGYYGAYIFILLKAVNGSITIGSLTFLAGSFRQMRSMLEGILTRFTSMTQGAVYLDDFFDFFDIEPKIKVSAKPRPFPKPILYGFAFENVGFRYTHSAHWALRKVSFILHPAEKLALVGENGAGKTTLVKLLARLYDPTEGRILLDGHDLKEYDPQELQLQIGIIFQDYIRYQMSFSQNIAIGNIAEKENLELIQTAARKSLADTIIEKLPGKYDQPLGKRFNEGTELSGGEWQKVALARAYMKEAQLLILDEPTAALDARAEYSVFQRFAELTKGKSAVLISHRFSTVRMADRILVLEKGELEEIGSHEELLQRNGRYAELFQLQAMGYR